MKNEVNKNEVIVRYIVEKDGMFVNGARLHGEYSDKLANVSYTSVEGDASPYKDTEFDYAKK